jgi:hypothetical protein
MTTQVTFKKENWILAQCHREDAVGQLARAWVEVIPSTIPLGKWLRDQREVFLKNDAVAQLNSEFATAADDIQNGRRTPTFPRRFLRQPEFDDRWEFHREHAHVSTKEHVEAKKEALAHWVAQRKIVYLDTCYWVNFRKYVLRQKGAEQQSADLLKRMQELVARDVMACPISVPLIEELMRQSDDRTRIATAELMDSLSRGLCLHDFPTIYRNDVNLYIGKRVFPNRSFVCKDWVWTRICWIFGEKWPSNKSYDPETEKLIQKVMIDRIWDSQVSDLVEDLDQSTFPATNYQEIADALKADAQYYVAHPEAFKHVLEKEKALIFHTFGLKDVMEEIARYFFDRYPAECGEAATREITQGFDPYLLPSLQILANVNASFVMNPNGAKANEFVDAAHAAVAIPHCDIFACDGPMAQRLKSPPLKLDELYSKTIAGNPGELMKALTHF